MAGRRNGGRDANVATRGRLGLGESGLRVCVGDAVDGLRPPSAPNSRMGSKSGKSRESRESRDGETFALSKVPEPPKVN